MSSWALKRGGGVCNNADRGSKLSLKLDMPVPQTLARIYKVDENQKGVVMLVKDLTNARSILPLITSLRFMALGTPVKIRLFQLEGYHVSRKLLLDASTVR